MGLFDDEDDDDYPPPSFSYQEERHRKPTRREMLRDNPSQSMHSEIFRETFGLHGVTWKGALFIFALIVAAIIFFLIKVGSNPTTIQNKVRAAMGETTEAQTYSGQVADISALSRLTVNSQGEKGVPVTLIGVRVSGRCEANAAKRWMRTNLRPGTDVTLRFSTTLGQRGPHSSDLVYMADGRGDVAEQMLRAGVVQLKTGQARASGNWAVLHAAAAKHQVVCGR